MNTALAADRVLEQLEYALGAGQFPADATQRGALLLSRLKSPVQVVLVGRPESGKSRLINMLIGETAISEMVDVPALEVAAGPSPATIYLMEDGSNRHHDGLHLDQPVPPGTAIVRIELPLAVLDMLTLTEVSISGPPADQKAAVDWAMRRADIILWCTQTFDAAEQDLWASARDALKDHSFLVLTKADQLLMKGVLPERIAELEEIVSEEFYSMFPVATIQAITARGADGALDETLWHSSGGKALLDAILRQVETGRDADTDNALVFLNRYAGARPLVTRGNALPNSGRVTRQSQRNAPGAPSGPGKADETPDNNGALDQALALLQERATAMINAMDENGADTQGFVLDHCLETANALTDIMMAVESSDASVSGIQDDVMECTDMMLLFQLEKTEDAAADAVTLLLQLKKEMAEATGAGRR